MTLEELKRLIKGAPSGEANLIQAIQSRRSNHPPGTEEWFKESFQFDPMQVPSGFRGRKKP